MSMNFSESTRDVYNRIQKLEPDHVNKIIVYLIDQHHGEQDMIRLAFSPENVIRSIVNKAKNDLGLSPKPAISGPLSPPLKFGLFSSASPRPFTNHQVGNLYWEHQGQAENRPIHSSDVLPAGCSDPMTDEYQLQNQLHFLSLDDHSDHNFVGRTFGPRSSRRTSSLPEIPVKICHYFNKGYCKHGNNCRYVHAYPTQESFSQVFNGNLNDVVTDEHAISPGSLKKLEMELAQLLKSKGGDPVSIASLPMLYHEMFGRTLQAEGYLTESQRHGKAGYSLTKLLSRLRNSIRVIDRPHGQHAVILAKDIHKYLECNGERNEHGAIVADSRQIYLTFPAESTFSEQDVSNYFTQFGPVQDVRIPCQQKRMFGFVTFAYTETVKQILSRGNPHLVCDARVLVKPYREKSKLVDRKCPEKAYQVSCYNPFAHAVSAHQSLHRRAIEFERRRFEEFQHYQMRVGYSIENLKLASEGHSEQLDFPSAEGFPYMLNVWNNGSTSNNKTSLVKTNHYDQERVQVLNLPESPFASPTRNSI